MFLRKTHTKGMLAKFPTRPEEDAGRKVPESREGAEQVSRQERGQSTEGIRTDQSIEKGSRQKRAGARTCGLR